MSNINKLKINNQPFDLFNSNNFQAGTNIGIAEFDNGDIEISTLTQGVEYIVGTQQSSTNVWTGTSLDMQCLNSTLYVGKVIIYHLPYNGNTSPATLNLTLADNSTTGDINVKYLSGTNVTNEFSAGYDIFMIYDGTQWKTSASGTSKRSLSIPFAKVDSTSTATAYTATVPGITELVDGTCIMLENGVVTSAAGFTLNINGLGAKPVFNNLTAATRDTTIFNVNYTMLFVYDSNRVVDSITGAWCCYRGYDSNTNTIGYQLRSNSYSKAMTDITYRYRLLFSSADNSKWVPANTSSSTDATASRAVCQTPINPFGEIVYYGTTASVAAGSRPSATNLWQQYTVTLGYSFNRTGAALTLTSWKPVYVKCAPQADGSAIMDSTTPYVQDLPTTDDGKIYIFLGVAYSATSIELLMNHPVFYYKDGAIRQWSNAYIPAAVQSNWNETDTSSAAYIQNKPSIPADNTLVHRTGDEPIGGQKTFSSTIVANGGIDVGQGTVSSEDSQDFSYITTGGGDTLQDALDEKQATPLVIEVDDTDTSVPSGTYASITAALAAGKDVVVKVTYTEDAGQVLICKLANNDSNEGEYIFSTGGFSDQIFWCYIDNSNSFRFNIINAAQEKTWLYMSVSGDTPSFIDANNNSLTHAQVIALLQDKTKDVIIDYGASLFICNYDDGSFYFGSVHPDEHRAESFSLAVAQNNSLLFTPYDDVYLVTNAEKTIWNNKADKFKNIVIVKSGTSPNYTYSLPSGTTAASIATDITTNGTTVVLSLDNEIYYYDRTTGSSSSTVLHFKYTDTTADGVVEKDLAIAYSNNAVTLTTTTADLSSKVSKVTSTDNAIARYDGTGGQIQNSGVTINDSNHVTAAKFITRGGTSSQFVKGDGTLDSGGYIKNYDFIVNASASVTSSIKKRIYDRDSQDSFWAANQRFVVTHKVYNVSDDSFVRDISTDVFKGSTLSWQNGVAEGEYAILYIGMHEDPVSESGYMFVYPYGYMFLTFYAGKAPEDGSVEVKAYFRDSSASWADCTVTKNSNIVYKIDIPNRTYLAGIQIKYKGTTPATDTSRPTSVTDVAYIRNSDTFDERNVVTKYPVAQNLYGNVTAPKFITRGGTSSQFVKGNGSLDSTTYTPQTSAGANSLLSSLPDWTAVPTDTTKLVRRDTGGSASFGQITFLTVWNYIKSKISSVLGIGGDNGVPTAPTAASGTNTTQVATTAFVQDALSNMGAGGSEMVDVTITGTTSSASFSTNPYNAIKAVVDDGKIAVLNASVAPLSTTGVLIPVYEYTYSQSGSDFTGYKGKIQNGNYEISVDVQSTSSATVTITSVGSSITVDTALSESSTNPVQNRVITAQILENEEIVATALNNLNDRVELKQDQLVSGTTIKTINNQSILGSGNISISGGGGGGGEENVIEIVKVNGVALTPDANKAVNITSVPGSIVTQDTTHRFVSDTEKTTWNGKQNALQYYSESSPDARINVSTDNTGEGSGSHGMITLACRDKMTDQAIAMSEISMDNVSLHHEEYDSSTGTTTLSQDVYIGNNGIKLNYDTSDNQGHEVVLSTNGFTYDNKQIATTDQIPSAVTESIVSGWGFTKNAGTITGITMNGSSKGTSGVVNLGTVVTSETDPVFTASAAYGITSANISTWNGKYTKPAAGIPDTDLTTAVNVRLLAQLSSSSDDGKIMKYSYSAGSWQAVKPVTIYSGSSAPSSSTGSNGDIYIQTS